MKTLVILGSLLLAASANASYFATHCSNARGTVKWETGHNSNSMTITDYEGSINISLSDVKIDLQDKSVIYAHQATCPSPMASKTEVYSGKATITPSENTPNVFGGKVYGDKLEVYVICEFHMNSRMYCPPTKN